MERNWLCRTGKVRKGPSREPLLRQQCAWGFAHTCDSGHTILRRGAGRLTPLPHLTHGNLRLSVAHVTQLGRGSRQVRPTARGFRAVALAVMTPLSCSSLSAAAREGLRYLISEEGFCDL